MLDGRIALSCDTETHLFGPSKMAPPIVCVSSHLAGAPEAELRLREPEGRLFLGEALDAAARGELVLTGHNFAYDMACALAMGDRELNAKIWAAYEALGIHCTYVRERLIDIYRGTRKPKYDLASLTAPLGIKLTGKDTYRHDYERLDGVPIEEWDEGSADYAKDDATGGLCLWLDQEERIRRMLPEYASWTEECGRQSAFAFALQLMKCAGIAVDQTAVKALRAKIAPLMLEHRQVMVEHGLIDAKKGSKSMKKIRELVQATWGDDTPVPRTAASDRWPEGQIKTDGETLEACHHPALIAAVEFSYWEKMLSGFVSKLEAAGEHRIHASYNVLVDTGRTSCSGPNMQQQYRKGGVRECFVAGPGKVLIFCDYDCQEVRALAEVIEVLVGQSRLAERFREDPDYDPHTHFAAELLHITYAEGMWLKVAKDQAFKEWRQRAKAAIFGFPGGMGAKKFRIYARGYGLELSLADAEMLRAKYFEFEPFVRDYFRIVADWTESGRPIRQLYSRRLRGGCNFPAAANSMFQGLGADITKSALWEVTKRCYGAPGTEGSALFGARPVIFIHDEIGIECPIEYAHEAAVELERVMVAAMEELTPHVPSRATPALMYRWSKDADAAFDENGRYIAWEDRKKEAA